MDRSSATFKPLKLPKFLFKMLWTLLPLNMTDLINTSPKETAQAEVIHVDFKQNNIYTFISSPLLISPGNYYWNRNCQTSSKKGKESFKQEFSDIALVLNNKGIFIFQYWRLRDDKLKTISHLCSVSRFTFWLLFPDICM